MDQRLVDRIRALNDPDLNQALHDHRRLHGELDALQSALWLNEDQKRQLHQLKRAKLSQKDKLLRLLSAREAAGSALKTGQR